MKRQKDLLVILKVLVIFLFFSLPFNLGKHFVIPSSYVGGILSNYLIPTLYVQDVVVILTLMAFLIYLFSLFITSHLVLNKKGLNEIPLLNGINPDKELKRFLLSTNKIYVSWTIRILLIYLLCSLFSIFFASEFLISFIFFLKLSVYVFYAVVVGFYILPHIDKNNFFTAVGIVFCFTTILLSVLGIAQWFNQGSIFNNYLVLGEQPYNFSTFEVNKTSFFGSTVIPPYGLFRHPNVFGGFLAVSIVLLISFIYKNSNFRYLGLFAVLLGICCMLLTFSFSSYLAFVVGLFALTLNQFLCKRDKVLFNSFEFAGLTCRRKVWVGLLSVCIFLYVAVVENSSTFFNNLHVFSSISRRHVLNINSANHIKDTPYFGQGLGMSPILSYSDGKNFTNTGFKSPQPVHNIFLLITQEVGVFGGVLFFVLFLTVIFKGPLLVSIVFLQYFVLGLFDHYLITSQQFQVAFWLTVSVFLAYNQEDDK